MTVRSARDLVHLRWRTAQLLLALVEGRGREGRALRAAMRVEGIDDTEMIDEFRLLRAQFGRRTAVHLAEEVSRLWSQLTQWCVRCGRRSRWLDNDQVCAFCVTEEPS